MVSDTPRTLIDKWASVPEIYLYKFEKAIIETIKSRQVLKNHHGGWSRSKELQRTRTCKSATHFEKNGEAAAMFWDFSSSVSTISAFEYNHAMVLINRFWLTFEVIRSQIMIWLEHLTNALVETIALPGNCGAPYIICRVDDTSWKPRHSRSSAEIFDNGQWYLPYQTLL